jgi:hypothetical protein
MGHPEPRRADRDTQGGLAFIGAAMDNYLRAFDLQTGKELWKGRLPAGGQATPMSYRLRENGRQFVIIAAGGHGRMGTDIGDSVVAFALPESGAGVLAQSTVSTLRTVGVLLLLLLAALLAALLVLKLAHKNWVWYPLLVTLVVIASWVAWIASQSIPVSLLAMLVAVAIAWILTVGRNRRSRAAPR